MVLCRAEECRAHLAAGFTQPAGRFLLFLKVQEADDLAVRISQEVVAVEIRTARHFQAADLFHQIAIEETKLRLVPPLLERFEVPQHVRVVVEVAGVVEAFRRVAVLFEDPETVIVLLNELDRVVDAREVLAGGLIEAGLFEDRLPGLAIVLELVASLTAAEYGNPSRPQPVLQIATFAAVDQ